MFSMTVGSRGEPPESYTLQVPLRIADDETFNLEEGSAEFELAGYRARMSGRSPDYLLRISGFASNGAAREFFDQLLGALLLATVDLRLGMEVESTIQDLLVFDPPKEITEDSLVPSSVRERGWTHIDAAIDASPAVIIPEHKRIMLFAAGRAHAVRGVGGQRLAASVQSALELAAPEAIMTDSRLSLAIDLYAASRHETTSRGRIVTLVTSLEALVAPDRVSDDVEAAIDHLMDLLRRGSSVSSPWQSFIGSVCAALGRPSNPIPELSAEERNSLRSRIGNLKRESIGRKLARFMASEAGDLGVDPGPLKKGMSHSYGVRSNLVHEGEDSPTEIERARSWLEEWVPKLLMSVARRTAGAS